MAEGRPIDTDLKKQAIELQKSLEWEDAGPERAALLGGTDTGLFPVFVCTCVPPLNKELNFFVQVVEVHLTWMMNIAGLG